MVVDQIIRGIKKALGKEQKKQKRKARKAARNKTQDAIDKGKDQVTGGDEDKDSSN